MGKGRYNIALLVSDLNDPFSYALASGAMDAAHEFDANLTIFPGKYIGIQDRYNKYDTAYEYQYNILFDLAAKANFDYIIAATGTIAYAIDEKGKREFLRKFENKRLLTLNAGVPGYECIRFDNRAGINAAVDHLAADGRKHICIMAGDLKNEECLERYSTYLEALERNGLEFRQEFMTNCDLSGECINEAERLFDRNPGMDAVVCANDKIAATVYDVLKSRGLQIGTDVAVTGFDNLTVCEDLVPPLASVNADAKALGRRSIEFVLNKLNNVPDNNYEFKTEYINRPSADRDPSYEKIHEKLLVNERAELMDTFRAKLHRNNVFIRDTLMFSGDLRYSYARIMKQLSYIGAMTSFIYTYEEPIVNNYGDTFPDELSWLFRSFSFGRASQTVPDNEQKMDTIDVFDNKYLCVNRQHCFIVADLYMAETQYGIALLEPADDSFFDDLELVTYQLSSAVKTLDILNNQAQLLEELNKKNMILDNLSKNDELTGVYNRRGFFLAAEAMIESGVAENGRFIICYSDLDNLKVINNNFGQNEGDNYIRAAADCFKTIFEDNAVIGRMGSSEFAVLFPKVEDRNEDFYLERKDKYAEMFNESGIKPYKLEINLGISEYVCQNSYDLKAAIDKADSLLFVEKAMKRVLN